MACAGPPRSSNNKVDLCTNDPGKDVDVNFTTTVKTMVDVWLGWSTYRKAIAQDELKLVGPKALINNVSAWMEDSIYADAAPASSI